MESTSEDQSPVGDPWRAPLSQRFGSIRDTRVTGIRSGRLFPACRVRRLDPFGHLIGQVAMDMVYKVAQFVGMDAQEFPTSFPLLRIRNERQARNWVRKVVQFSRSSSMLAFRMGSLARTMPVVSVETSEADLGEGGEFEPLPWV